MIQANAAIFSVSSIFYIFKIQSLNNNYQSSVQLLRMLYSRSTMGDKTCAQWLRLTINDKKKQIEESGERLEILSTKKDIVQYFDEIFRFKHTIITPLLTISFVIIIEIISLLLVNVLFEKYTLIIFYFVYINTILQLYIIFVITKFILKSLETNIHLP